MTKKTKASLGMEAARGVVTDPGIRRAAAEAAPPVAKLSFDVGRRFARRRKRKQLRHLEHQLNPLGALIGRFGCTLAQQIGATRKEKRAAPRIATGVVIGAVMMYLLGPGSGAAHRHQVQRLVVGLVS